MKKGLLLLLFGIVISCFTIKADEEEPKFKVSPSGRVLIDGALYASPEKYLFKDGMAIPEARLGAKMSYGKWSSWIDVGFAYGKIGLRNMWIQYDFNQHHSLRAGNYLQPFGLQSISSANVKATFEMPLAASLFNSGLQLGVMYTFKNKSLYSATSFHVESSALTNVMNYPAFNQQGYTLLTRFVWRKANDDSASKPLFQAGLSLGFSSPERTLINEEDKHDGFTISANFPTRVSTQSAIGVTITDAINRFKLSPELIFAYKRFGLESQYFFQTIAMKNHQESYQASGFYVTLRGLLMGKEYKYDSVYAQLANPSKKSLEFVADYNYAKVGHKINANSLTMTLNYYFNQYITARLNYTFTKVIDKNWIPDQLVINQNAFQLRLMVLF